jgi:CheY-like chemotaxis protein
MRVLIIEDNRDTARTLQLVLRRYGHDVEVAHTGRAGVEAARVWQPDVALCDLGLPEMDGFEVATALRQDPLTADVRMIAITGYGRPEDKLRSRAVGFEMHLTKPVDPRDLQLLLTDASSAGV